MNEVMLSVFTKGSCHPNALNLQNRQQGTVSNIQQEEGDKAQPESNGLDNEDSINLTIGEDEEKLLTEEVQSPIYCINILLVFSSNL